jgi:hypothetical protein
MEQQTGGGMAVLAIFSGAMTPTQYDTLRFTVDWARNKPAGAILHAASFDEAGRIHVADVWASQEDLEDFISRRLMPVIGALRIPPPEVAIYPIHTLQAYEAIGAYLL